MKLAAVSLGHCFWDAPASPLNSFTEKQNIRILGVGWERKGQRKPMIFNLLYGAKHRVRYFGHLRDIQIREGRDGAA